MDLKNLKILIIDDHQLFLQGLRQLLLQLGAIVDISENAERALESLPQSQPDLVLIDLAMPDMDGLSFIQAVAARELLVPVVVVSASEELDRIQLALSAGAFGFLPKSATSEQLQFAIEKVMAGEIFVGEPIASRLAQTEHKRSSNLHSHGLSKRQIQVLNLLAKGYTNKKISLILYVSDETVKSHIRSIFQALNASSRTEAVAKAHSLALLEMGHQLSGH